ncbi:glutathione-regulated potassium-efflux system protein KefB [Mesorhizobium sp. J18]|uniref:monovalent cation:proton antiporter-2 (CPA2) family protein n=1 Tax=Mesorhizobium sp. J18 TaxID=935263 RepID=UPI00119B72D4|nr:monovalent cation:proton antiporter-2 (CPA2) family protein [Mesorhizobium sp. J18]TWG93823.1 glutathione-regulated potassium-efflux system protein KefB [Mesorhizobium sp. J18]
MAAEAGGSDLVQVVALLAAGVIAVPIFKRLGLGSVLGYLTAGLIIGPFGIGLFSDPQAILHVAELGVVMFLFVIGLEMQPSRLWGLRREIFGLGAAQVAICGALLTGAGIVMGFSPLVAFVAGMGFVLSSTAIVMQLLDERGDVATPQGQRVVSILLLEDLAIVPLLALVAFMAPGSHEGDAMSRLNAILIALASLAALVAAGRWLLNPMFQLLALSHAREVMTAAALLVVLGAALAMQLGGLSMAMGAFLAGVLLSESTFRHQLEADIEPFRGILLGLFFLGVGMSLDLGVIAREWPLIAMAVVVYMALKSAGIYTVARLLKANHAEALTRAALLAQGGEFAFVLFASAASVGILNASTNAVLTATVIISMALTPLLMLSLRWILPEGKVSMDGIDVAEGLQGRVLIIGFGRFGQIVSQPLLLRGVDVSIIDNDVEMIRAAATFGFKVYYGDGTRLDILHAAGADNAEAILVCVDNPDATRTIVERIKSEFPLTPVLARAYDRGSALQLIREGIDFQIRETVESALVFGRVALEKLGVDPDEAAEIVADVRHRDQARLEAQLVGGITAGRNYMASNMPVPAPLAQPRRAGRALNDETAGMLAGTESETAK